MPPCPEGAVPANVVTRTNAVTPTAMAPITEKIICHVSDGMVCFTMPWVGVVAGDCGRRDEGDGDHEPQPKRLHEHKQDVPDAESDQGRYKSDGNAAEPSCACAIGPCADCDAGEQRQRIDREIEQHTAEDDDCCDAGDDTDEDHGDGLP